ncbi:MAG: MaoC family dehydratase [Sphingomonas sp.]
MRYFEDIAVGATASFGRYAVTREEVLDFARRYDPQPFHLSDEAAAETHFGRLSASGWHTCAMTMRMLVEHFEHEQLAGLGSPGIDELRWLKPVYPGDALRCETEVLDKRPSRSRPEMGSYRSRTTVFNQDDVPVMTFVSSVLIRTRPAG